MMTPRVMRTLILCLCGCFLLHACTDNHGVQTDGDAVSGKNEILPIRGLIAAPDTPMGRKLKALQTEALPAALEGNAIAINICRQTMHGLGELTALEEVTFDLVRPLAQEALDKWGQRLLDDANRQDPIARTIIGALFYTGQGAPHNPGKALELWEEAALGLDYHDALSKLGNLYRSGEIVERDMHKAVEYYTRAGALGSSNALWSLGSVYFRGDGVPQDRERAILYYQMAAGMGHTKAQFDLGLCYENGHGIRKNLDEAVRWYRAAAGSGEYLGNVGLVRLGYPAVRFPPAENDKAIELEDTPVPTYASYHIRNTFLQGIYRSIRVCDLRTIDEAVKIQPDILHQKDLNGWTPLTLAVTTGCKKTVAYLIDKGVDVNQPHQIYNVTALHIAVQTNQSDTVALLIENGADMDSLCDPPPMYWYSSMVGTSLHTAVHHKRWEILKLLLEKGADYNKPNLKGQTVFDYAEAFSHRDEVTSIFEEVGLPIPRGKEGS